MTDFYINLGARIREIREKTDIKVSYIAYKTGLSEKFIYQVERGEKGISAENLNKMCETLGVNSDYLMNGNSDRYNSDGLNRLIGELDDNEKKAVTAFIKVSYDKDIPDKIL